MKNKNTVSTHLLIIDVNNAYKSNFLSPSALQRFCENCLTGKLTEDNTTDEIKTAVTQFNKLAKEIGLTVQDIQFSVFLNNYERITGHKLTDSKGTKKSLFQIYTFLKVIEKVKKETKVTIVPHLQTMPEITPEKIKKQKTEKVKKVA